MHIAFLASNNGMRFWFGSGCEISFHLSLSAGAQAATPLDMPARSLRIISCTVEGHENCQPNDVAQLV